MSFQHLGKGALRVAKNYTKGYSDVQAKVRDATSNDPWGPSGTQMNEIAQLTYNQNDFVEIMEMLDKRLNDKGKNWRHVFKALTLLDYCLHAGSENVVIYFRDNVYLVKTLKEFQYIDEYGKDQGANVRQKAKDITNLLQDESRLRQERRSRANMRDRMVRGGPGGEDTPEDENTHRRSRSTPAGSRRVREDDEFQKALEASKRTAELEAQKTALSAEERDLQRAIKLSEEEEAKRAKAVEEANSKSLFEDGTAQAATAANTNPFPLVDASALQPQYTLQPQFTIQPQITSFNPYLAQQQQEAQQLAWAQQQQEWQQQEWLRQQAELQAQAQQQAQNDWAMQQLQLQQLQQMQSQQQQQALQQQQQLQQQQTTWLQAQPTSPLIAQTTGFGSKNPFALSPASAVPPVPQLPTSAPSYSPGPAPSRSAPPTTSQAPTVKVSSNPDNEALAALFANREGGTDTFGNYGNLRFGHTTAGRALATSQTGPAQQPGHTDQPFFSV